MGDTTLARGISDSNLPTASVIRRNAFSEPINPQAQPPRVLTAEDFNKRYDLIKGFVDKLPEITHTFRSFNQTYEATIDTSPCLFDNNRTVVKRRF